MKTVPSLEEIDRGLRETEVRARRAFLINQLKSMGIDYTRDGRRLEECSLYTLEWTHIEAKNEAARACGEE